eukprot:gene38904-14982_t
MRAPAPPLLLPLLVAHVVLLPLAAGRPRLQRAEAAELLKEWEAGRVPPAAMDAARRGLGFGTDEELLDEL